MSIKSLKHSISSLKLAKKSNSAIFKDSTFSSLISRYFDSDVKNNAFIDSNINSSPKSAYYDTLYELIKANESSPIQLKAIALKFQKILSLEVEQFIIQRLLNNQYANHLSNNGGRYDIFPKSLYCPNCNKEYSIIKQKDYIDNLKLNKIPTICTLWHHLRLPRNFQSIGELVGNPFDSTPNNKATLYYPLNLLIVHNGNHSANVALYENNTSIKKTDVSDVSHWFNDIYFDPKTNTLNHITCGTPVDTQQLFHENIGYIYEISRLLYQNNIFFTSNDLL